MGVQKFVHTVVAAFSEHLVVAFFIWLRRHDGDEMNDNEDFWLDKGYDEEVAEDGKRWSII